MSIPKTFFASGILSAALFLLVAPPSAQAQKTKNTSRKRPAAGSGKTVSRDSLKDATVAVYQTYQPEMRVVGKPVFTPSAVPADGQSLAPEIRVEPQAGTTQYYPIDIRPLALEKDSLPNPRYGYNKIGAGSRGSFLLESAGNLYKDERFLLALYSRYWRQNDAEVFNRRQRISENILSAQGKLGGGTLAAVGDLTTSKYGEYGFQERMATPSETFRKYLGFGLRTRYTLEQGPLQGLTPEVGFRLFDGPQIGSEKTLQLGFDYERPLTGSLRLRVVPKVLLTSVGISGTATNNSLATLGVAGVLQQDRLALRAGIIPVLGRDAYRTVLPDLWLAYQFLPQKAEIQLGWQGQMLQNRLEDLTQINPFLNRYTPVQTRSREAFAQLGFNINPRLTVRLRGSWIDWRNLAVFVNDTAQLQGFATQYLPTANDLRMGMQLRYSVGEAIQLGTRIALHNYMSEEAERLWHMPALELGADLFTLIRKKLQIHTQLDFMDLNYPKALPGTVVGALPAVIDLSLSAEYPVAPRWSLWLQSNNLLNRRNERFYGYPAISRSVFGGVRVKL